MLQNQCVISRILFSYLYIILIVYNQVMPDIVQKKYMEGIILPNQFT
ncbi:hypothetical protein Mpsy_1549 [Methanolobus psychrophilus R15]|nr:hypothetical protein Mpsy_1549 [Methanolobus psychrophilus R15]